MDPNSLIGRTLHPFASLFGGAPDPRLGEDANRQAMRNAILTGGLTTIAAASQPGASGLGSIAQGALVGQQAGQAGRQQARIEGGRDQIAQMAEAGIDIPTARQMLVQALSTGDMESAKYLTAALTSMQASQRQTAPPSLRFTEQTIGDQRVQIANDPVTGEEVFRRDLGPAPQPNIQFTPPVSDDMGDRSIYAVDRTTGQRVYWGQGPGGAGDGTFQERAAAVRAESALQDVETAFGDPQLRELVVGSLAEAAARGGFISAPIANWALGRLAPETQEAAAARDRVAALVQNIMSGAQMSNQERGYYRQAYTPARGDTDPTNSGKRASVVFMLNRLAGAGIDPNADPESLTPEQRAQVTQIVREAGAATGVAPGPPTGGLFDDLVPPGR